MKEIKIEENLIYKTVAIRNNVLFPGQVLSIEIGRDKSLSAIETSEDGYVFILAQKDATVSSPSANDLYRVGTLAKVQQKTKLVNGSTRILLQGIKRLVVEEFIAFAPHIEVKAVEYGEVKTNEETQALINLINEEATKLAKLAPKNKELKISQEPAQIIATMAYAVYESDVKRQRLLEVFSLNEQLSDVYAKTISALDLVETEKNIAKRVRDSIEKNQKEFYLREQIKAIHEELGDDEKEKDEFDRIAKEKGLPEYAVEKLNKEMKRLEKMAPNSPEAGVARTYIEWLLDMPWNVCSEDNISLPFARTVLNEDHYGLEKIKERIVEYLAVHTLTKNNTGAILCFVGPPGVGKTSIVSSIARAANRTLVQMSLGGVRDEAEIRGHRRTYVGSMPGRILSGMKNAGVNNPVFLLDEIDKMSSDFRGDPSSAMLEVLDPNQNSKFIDHYLEIPYDLSKTMFVATANSIESIPTPLLDRMEVIYLTGYTYNEKLEIAKRYLLPKQIEKNGMKAGSITIADNVLMKIITLYTKESGVRSLEREIATVIRKIAVKHVENGASENEVFEVLESDLSEYLGASKYKEFAESKEAGVGIVTGLAWTSVGGVTLDVETALLSGGKGDLVLTGSMGDVMKESARIALSVVRARAEKYGIDKEKFTSNDVHIHIPEGATPKDGPSAGITLSTALTSIFSGKKVRNDVAMTGEVTLTGRVLAIGGLKEKSLAAYMSGIKYLIIPKENEKDIKDIPTEVKESVEIITVSTVDEVLDFALIND